MKKKKHNFFPRKRKKNFPLIIQHISYRGVTQLRKLLYNLDIVGGGWVICQGHALSGSPYCFADTRCLFLRPWEVRLQQFTAGLDDYTDGVTQRTTLGRRIGALENEH